MNLRDGDAAVAQSVERRLGKAEVTGPIPVSSSFFITREFNRVSKPPASNAQSIKRWVGGLTCLTPKASLVEWEYKLPLRCHVVAARL